MPSRKSRSKKLALAVLAVGLLLASIAGAHQVGIASGWYRLTGETLGVEFVFARGEVMALLPELDRDSDGLVSQTELDSGHPAIAQAIVAEVVSCPGKLVGAEIVSEDALRI